MAGPIEFHVHTELGKIGLSPDAFLVFMRCGNWTARNDADGIVPAELPQQVAQEIEANRAVNELVGAGLWEPLRDGRFRMLRGPSQDWDAPMPLWRYSTHMEGRDLGGGFTEFPDPDE